MCGVHHVLQVAQAPADLVDLIVGQAIDVKDE
jgi:hypothetical protein